MIFFPWLVGQRVLCAIHTRPSSGSPEEQVSLQDKCKRNDIFCISTLSYKELRTCTYHFNMAGYWLLPGFCHYPGQIMSKNIRIFFSISAINFKVLFTHTHTHTHTLLIFSRPPTTVRENIERIQVISRFYWRKEFQLAHFLKFWRQNSSYLSTLSTCFYIIIKNPVIDILFNKYWLRDIYF